MWIQHLNKKTVGSLLFAGALLSAPTRRIEPDHIGAYNFKVEIEGIAGDVVEGAFKSAGGIESRVELLEYQQGEDIILRKRPGRVKYGDITLKKGYLATTAFYKWREGILGELDWRIHASFSRVVPAAHPGDETPPDAEAQRRGYVVFTRPYTYMIHANHRPRPDEIVTTLACAACPGEYEPVTFALRPLRELRKVAVTVSGLRGPGGSSIPSGRRTSSPRRRSAASSSGVSSSRSVRTIFMRGLGVWC